MLLPMVGRGCEKDFKLYLKTTKKVLATIGDSLTHRLTATVTSSIAVSWRGRSIEEKVGW